jgi:hypothetical protein
MFIDALDIKGGSWEHPYIPRENYVTCEFFSARKASPADVTIDHCY